MTWIALFRTVLSDRRGAVAIEFAAIALPLVLILGGTIEISRYTWTRMALQDAASTGARCLGLRLAPCFVNGSMDQSETMTVVTDQAMQWGVSISSDPGTVTPEAVSDCQNTTAVDFARVGIRHRFSSVLAALADTSIEVEACFPVSPA